MSALVDSTPESREFQERLRVAAQKARNTPFLRPDGSIARDWTKGYIALAIDSRGNVLGFDSLPQDRAKHLNYQVLKALRARVLSEHAKDIRKDPSKEENIAILEGFGIERKQQYIGAKDDVQLKVGSEFRWVYVVGGATIPDSEYVVNVYGEPSPKDYSYLDGVDPLEAEMDDAFGTLVLHYLLNPDAEAVTILEPHKIAWIRNKINLLRKDGSSLS